MLQRAAVTKIHFSLQHTRTIQLLYCNHRTWHTDKLERESCFVYYGSDGIHWKVIVWLLLKQIPAPLWRVFAIFGSKAEESLFSGVTFLPPEIDWRIRKSTCLQVTLQKPLPSHNFNYKGKERLKCSIEEFIRIFCFHQKTHSLKINPSLKSEHFQLFSTMTKNACFVCKHVVLRQEKSWFSDYIKCLILMEMDKVWGCHLFGFYPGSRVLVLVKVLHRLICSTLAYYTDGLSCHFTRCFGHKQCKRLPASYSRCRRQKA